MAAQGGAAVWLRLDFAAGTSGQEGYDQAERKTGEVRYCHEERALRIL
jgi:hypothetical protein